MRLPVYRERLTWIFSIFRAHILVTRIQDILVHECGTRCNLPEEGHLDWLSDLDSLAFLHEDLPGVFTPVLAVEGWHAVLLGMVAFLEGLQSRHEVMSSGHTRSDDTLRDTCGDGTLDDRGHGVHRSDDLVLELWRYVEFDLLEEVF